MADDRELAERLRVSIGDVAGLGERAMFGPLAFLVGGSMAVAAGSDGGLRCGATRPTPTGTPVAPASSASSCAAGP